MTNKEIYEKLERIEEALTAKGHPMQDYSTFKMALLDVVAIMREMLKKTD